MPGTLDAAIEDGTRENRLSARGKVAVALAATLAVVAAVAVLLIPFRWTGTETVTVNAYVVPSADLNDPRDESFAAVASRTLGDPGRADEVFALNRGRTQTDGSVVTSSTEPARPGWVLVLPTDASGDEVRLAQTVRFTPYWTWPLILSLAGAVLVGTLTVLIVGRRVVTDGSGRLWRRLRDLPGAVRHRVRSRAERARLRGALDAGLGSPAAVAAAMEEISPWSDGGVHSATTDGSRMLARVSPVAEPPAGWVRADPGVWSRAGLPPVTHGSGSGSLPVRVGGDEYGNPVLVDLARVDGVVAVTGDRAVAGDLISQVVGDAVAQRPDLTVVTLSAADADVAAATGVPDGRPERRAATEHRGVEDLFVAVTHEREVTGIVVVPFEPNPATASALVTVTTSSGWVALVEGEIPGAHRRWRTRRDGALELPELGLDVMVPLRAVLA